MPDRRYSEGQREPIACPTCGQAAWRVFHGPRRNHSIEPRADIPFEVQRLRERVTVLEKALGEIARADETGAGYAWPGQVAREALDA